MLELYRIKAFHIDCEKFIALYFLNFVIRNCVLDNFFYVHSSLESQIFHTWYVR
ncbi:hypothetical protein CPter291_1019 [Collimonas pratensis]|uniref:Uncharacterized protein n=1 Tax=Collimonas pratensis TaxID=279113 RepID=A0ABN4MCK0_9BURK|nr:hypothetical protein CPter291_1019 [Collimonas pratensis]